MMFVDVLAVIITPALVDASWRRDLARRVYILCSFIDAKLDSAKIEIRRLSPGF
jgi:hypothetical protein